MIKHPIPPVYDSNSKILILGSFPSIKSREQTFFYAHPQNRFWKVLASLFQEPLPSSIEEKKSFLIRNHVAVWDVIGSCEIVGSLDSSIKEAKPNDIEPILKNSNIIRIFVNGKTAEKYYKKYIEQVVGIKAICLPSTSPANNAIKMEKLIAEWCVIL